MLYRQFDPAINMRRHLSLQGAGNGFQHSREVVFAQVAAAGQAEAVFEQLLRQAVAEEEGIFKYRLQVHRFPERAALDIFCFQRQPDMLSRHAAGPGGIDEDAGQPAVGDAVFRLVQQRNALPVAQRLLIEFKHLVAPPN